MIPALGPEVPAYGSFPARRREVRVAGQAVDAARSTRARTAETLLRLGLQERHGIAAGQQAPEHDADADEGGGGEEENGGGHGLYPYRLTSTRLHN